jgi:predicted CopG family antitoxin
MRIFRDPVVDSYEREKAKKDLTAHLEADRVRLSKTHFGGQDMSRTTKTMTVSLPPQIYKKVVEMAVLEHKTKSELFRDMIAVYETHLLETRWRRVREIGREIAKDFSIESEEDVEKIIREFRQSKK